jgi:outer membrane lipoprotein-sorting protein
VRLLKSLVLALFSYAVLLSAQTADDIVAKNIQAQGGMVKLKAIQSMRVTGDFAIAGMQAGFTQVYKRPMKVRLDASIQGMTLTRTYDGQSGWQVNPFGGKGAPEPMAGDDLKQMQEEAEFDGPLVDYKQKGNTIQLVGKESIDGADAYHLKVTLKSGDLRDLYIDANSFLLTKTVAKTVVQGAEVQMESKFADYREVQGVKLPFSIDQHAMDGQIPDQKITFQKVDMNIPVEDSLFTMPAAAGNAPPAQPKPQN